MRKNEFFFKLEEGITHIEDLAIDEFVEAVKNLEAYDISEKVDGANLVFGWDEVSFYTSREAKGQGKRFRRETEYEKTFANTYKRSAHLALESVFDSLRAAGLTRGCQIEIEVLFGGLPNTVPYNAEVNRIIFLRVLEGDVNLKKLHKAMANIDITVSLICPYTTDGETVAYKEEQHKWNFVNVPPIDLSIYNKDKLFNELQKNLSELETFLKQPSGVLHFSNAEVLSLPLNKKPNIGNANWSEVKQLITQKREQLTPILFNENGTGYKNKIKNLLLNTLVRKVKSSFGPEITNGGWIEGLVFRNKETGKQFKLVDKDFFTLINKFNYEVRNSLSTKPMSKDKISSFLGEVLMTLSSSIGHPDLATIGAKRYLRKFGNSKEEIVNALSKDANYEQVKNYWLNYLDQSLNKLQSKLKVYNSERNNKKFNLQKDGHVRTFTYNDEIHNRTLQVFSEMFSLIKEMKASINDSKTTQDLVLCLVGKQLEDI